jgi:thiol-disulfide isomerase/thioredoxin
VIGGANAGRIGPLALIRLFNRAFSAPLQLSLLRNGRTIPITWYRSADAPDATTTFPPLGASLAFQAPAFVFRSTDGLLVSLGKQRGHWVLVNFWGTWCTPCRVEAPILSRLQHDYPDRLTVVGLALNDTPADLQRYIETVHPGYSLVNVGSLNSSVAVRYGVSEPVHGGSLPVSVLIRPDGQVAYVQGGGTDVPLEAEIRAQVGEDSNTR